MIFAHPALFSFGDKKVEIIFSYSAENVKKELIERYQARGFGGIPYYLNRSSGKIEWATDDNDLLYQFDSENDMRSYFNLGNVPPCVEDIVFTLISPSEAIRQTA